jgi:hypothetical protein
MLNVGTRFRCEVCGAEAIVTKGGEGEICCHDQPMAVVTPSATSS